MKNIIVMAVLLLVIASAIYYIVSQKKKGAKCIGCPCSKNCGGNCNTKKQSDGV